MLGHLKCAANRRTAVEAKRRSTMIDEQLKAEARQQPNAVCILPVFGTEEAQALVLEHFITRIPDDELDSTASVEKIRENILRSLRRFIGALACGENSTLGDSTRAIAEEVHTVCYEEDDSRVDEHFAENLTSLWSDPEVRNAYSNSYGAGPDTYGDL